MAICQYLLIAALLFHTSQSLVIDESPRDNKISIIEEVEEDLHRLPIHTVPIHYDIRLIPHIVEDNFTSNGEISIDIEVHNPTNAIVLHAKQLTIDESETKLTRKNEDNVNTVPNYVPIKHDYNYQAQILTVQFEEPLDPGIYTLYFKFLGVIADDLQGFYSSYYKNSEGDKVWLAITHFQPVSARQAFPCWDEPALKATFKVSIKHYPNYTALSNMPSTRSEVDIADGKVWTYFETTPVMSTNLLGFVIADYDYISNLEGTIKIWGPKHSLSFAPYSLYIAEKAMRELEIFTNITVPVPKMDHVAVPQYLSNANEVWGMILYKQRIILQELARNDINTYKPPNYWKTDNTLTITHELAHQWFGNLVSPAWWDCLWLSEGISTYLKYYIADKFLKEWQLMDYFVLTIMEEIFNSNQQLTQPININITWNIHDAYNRNTYSKSAILLRMASHFLTEDIFRNGLRKYLQRHKYSHALPENLWEAMQESLDESEIPHDDFKVKEVMDTWFEQAGYPIVTINRDYVTGDIKVTQKAEGDRNIYNNIENNNATWWIPLNFATQKHLNFSSTLATHWLRPQDENLTITNIHADKNDWIIANKQLTGFYRVNYDINNWKRISEFLNSDNYTKIPALSRSQIISDAFFFLRTNQLDYVTFLELINYLSQEVDVTVWYSAFKIIQKLGLYSKISDEVALKPYILNLMQKLFEHIGFDDHDDDNSITIQTRSDVIYYSCMYGSQSCKVKAVAKLLQLIENSNETVISHELNRILCFGFVKMNESIWDKVLQTQNKISKRYDMMKYLGCTEDLNIIKKQIDYVATEEEEFTKHMHYYSIFGNMKNLLNADAMFDIFINNTDKFNTNNDNALNILNVIVHNCVRQDQIEKIKVFSEQHGIDVNYVLNKKNQEIIEIKNILSIIHGALEKNKFSPAVHAILNNKTS